MTEDQLERAAILEVEAGKPRAVAEKEAQQQRPPTGSPRCTCAACVRSGRATVLGG